MVKLGAFLQKLFQLGVALAAVVAGHAAAEQRVDIGVRVDMAAPAT
jgi:hypothetical protein